MKDQILQYLINVLRSHGKIKSANKFAKIIEKEEKISLSSFWNYLPLLKENELVKVTRIKNRDEFNYLETAAKAVTGSHWNGKLFWGVTKRRSAR